MSDGEITIIGPECFASTDDTVISWKGVNYYQACDELVVAGPKGSSTHCVKRVDHPGDIHEDYDGFRKTDDKARMAVVVTLPLAVDTQIGFENASEVMQQMKGVFADQPDILIYGAIKDKADQIIMILDGDG